MLNSFRNTVISALILAIAGTVGLQYLGYPLHKIMDTPSIEESSALVDELLVDLGKGDYESVLQSISKLERMRGTFPDDLIYVKSLSLQETGQSEAAIETADTYLEKTGDKGTYYTQILSLRAQVEIAIKSAGDDRATDRLISLLAEQIKAKRYKDGLSTIGDLEALDRPLPVIVQYYKGFLLILQEQYTEGRLELENYLAAAEEDATNYSKAETLLAETLVFDEEGQERVAAQLKVEAAERTRIAETKRKAEEAERIRIAEEKRKAEEAARKAEQEQKRLAEIAAEQERQRVIEERRSSPGLVFRDCETCPEMVTLPTGEFLLGSPKNERDRGYSEDPQQLIHITAPFAVGKFEITVSQFQQFVEESGHSVASGCTVQKDPRFSTPEDWEWSDDHSWRNPRIEQRPDEPVVCITKSVAKAYTSWLSQKTGEKYRLLKEYEWEYMARGGTQHPYFYGAEKQELCIYGNVVDKTWNETIGIWMGFIKCSDGYYRTAPVGLFSPNPFGIYDTIGNVNEIVDGCYSIYGDDSFKNCDFTLFRGGSYSSDYERNRSAHRGWLEDVRRSNIGFRIAREL